MSQINVERIIGLLATDEAIRRRFSRNPRGLLAELVQSGMELNASEWWSLASLDLDELRRFAQAVKTCVQRADRGGEV